MTDVGSADLQTCAAEPIQIPGAIQPHGALLVADSVTLACLNASANLEQVTGLPLRPGDLLDARSSTAVLVERVRSWLSTNDPATLFDLRVGDRDLQVVGHRSPQGLLLEFEPVTGGERTLGQLYPRLSAFLNAVSEAASLLDIAQAAVGEFRELTGFDRVLLYSFDRDGHGTVLAEDGNGRLPSYLGLRFPASDIPPQARELYRLNRIRLIPDADYRPVPVHPPTSPIDERPLDLSLAALRSVSPVHLEYMRNMGTGASMSVSILVDGALWGLVSAHNRAPRKVGPQVRSACDTLGQILSLQIEARQKADRTSERLGLKQIETVLVSGIAATRVYQRGLVESAADWLALTRAHGAAIVTAGTVASVGLVPEESEIRQIAAELRNAREEVFATDSMAEVWDWAGAFAPIASGLLAISISQIRPDYILWFRPEVVRTVSWSGDPTKSVEPGADRLHPRKSFELWKELVQRRSLAWSLEEIDSARGFRNSIQNLVLKRAEERAELTSRLEEANRELEAFSYSVSHDLRAPFRHIVGFSELLADRVPDLDAKSVHYIKTIKDAAAAAGRLVDDLLAFSQLGRSQLAKSPVNMLKLVEETRRSLAIQVSWRRIEWRVGALPHAWGDPPMLRQVVQNLLQNAVKYSSTRDLAEISISGEDHGESTSYTITDNGVGFEMEYVGKLFGVFQRLHRAEQFEGTGIGLALVKRIVDRHDGTVSAYGEPDRGATFSFTLPKRPVESTS